VTVAVDGLDHVVLLNDVVPNSMVLRVVIEIDTGYHRCGVPLAGPYLGELAEAIARSERLHFAGLMGYEGHAVLEPDRDERVRLVRGAARILTTARDALAARGLPCQIVSGGGTGTLDLWPEAGPLTEVQAGSYVLMDSTYGGLNLRFSNALFCLSRVVSRWGDRGVGDAGLKSMSKEYGLPTLLGPGHVTVSPMSMCCSKSTPTSGSGWGIPSGSCPRTSIRR
jgi:D-serine deaminase-like pyridoxal phosphate-dependent protein